MIIKNTDPYKIKKCITCKKEIPLQEKYFTYPLSLQCICLNCSLKEIPKIIEVLEADLEKTRGLLNSDTSAV
jgi:recombinational DNA repair protein (RecF pathway)